MGGFRDELRALRTMRKEVGLELLCAAAAAIGLFAASGRLAGAGPEAQVVFILCLAAFGSSTAHLVPRLVEAACFRCPRCGGLFHASDAPTPVIRLRACAHCELSVREGAPPR